MVIGFGIGGIAMGNSLLENKLRALWFALASAVLGIITGILIGRYEKAIEWGILYTLLGTTVGYGSYSGWKKIIVGAAIGLIIAILAGTKMSFDNLKIENEILHITISMLTGILLGGFWGSLFQIKPARNSDQPRELGNHKPNK
jgi:cation transporter-like permease